MARKLMQIYEFYFDFASYFAKYYGLWKWNVRKNTAGCSHILLHCVLTRFEKKHLLWKTNSEKITLFTECKVSLCFFIKQISLCLFLQHFPNYCVFCPFRPTIRQIWPKTLVYISAQDEDYSCQKSHEASAWRRSISSPFLTEAPCAAPLFMKSVSPGL